MLLPNGKKKLRIRYRLSVVFFGSVLIFGLVFYNYMKNTSLEEVLSEDRNITYFNHSPSSEGDTEADKDNAAADQDSTVMVNPVPECEAADKSYLNDCVFVGDSLIYGLIANKQLSSENVLSSMSLSVTDIDGQTVDTPSGEKKTVIDALNSLQPKNIYVMLGSNGIAYKQPTELYTDYQAFLTKAKTACPNSDIYVISTPPVTHAKETAAELQIKNSNIDELNSMLLDFCNSNAILYLELNSALKGTDGCLLPEYAENDGMHINSSAYEVFINYILTHVRQ